VRTVAVTPDARVVLTGGEDGSVRVWDVLRGQGQVARPVAETAAALTRQGTIEPAAHVSDPVRSWLRGDAEGFRGLQRHETYAVTSDGARRVSGRRDRRLRVFDHATGRCLHTLRGHTRPIAGIDLSPDGRLAVSAGDTVRVWDIETGAIQCELEGSTTAGNAVRVSPDGTLVAAVGQTCGLWDLYTGDLVATLAAPTSSANALGFSANGRFCIAGGDDGAVLIWDLPAASRRSTAPIDERSCGPDLPALPPLAPTTHIHGHEAYVGAVCLSADGSLAASADGDGMLRLWDVARAELLSVVRLPAPADSCRIRWNVVIVADTLGGLHLYNIRGRPSPVPAAAATRLWRFGAGEALGAWDEALAIRCVWCETTFAPDQTALGALAECLGTTATQPPCLCLPVEAWEDERLQVLCPECGMPLRLTPFIADGSRCAGIVRGASAVHQSAEAQESGHQPAGDGGAEARVLYPQDRDEERAGEGGAEGGADEVGGVQSGG